MLNLINSTNVEIKSNDVTIANFDETWAQYVNDGVGDYNFEDGGQGKGCGTVSVRLKRGV